MKNKKKVTKQVQQSKVESKPKDGYNKLLADVEKTNPEFTEWIKSKQRRKNG